MISCGMGGYDSYRDAMVQREILDYQPDAIVVMSGSNADSSARYPYLVSHSPAAPSVAFPLAADRWRRHPATR